MIQTAPSLSTTPLPSLRLLIILIAICSEHRLFGSSLSWQTELELEQSTSIHRVASIRPNLHSVYQFEYTDRSCTQYTFFHPPPPPAIARNMVRICCATLSCTMEPVAALDMRIDSIEGFPLSDRSSHLASNCHLHCIRPWPTPEEHVSCRLSTCISRVSHLAVGRLWVLGFAGCRHLAVIYM